MTIRGSKPQAVFVVFFVALVCASSGRAYAAVNPFSGQWNTLLSGRASGTVKFSAVSALAGIPALQAMSGQPCAVPTVYYHGDYTNSPPYGMGTMTACTANKGHLQLVGRWQGGPDKGHFDIALGVGLVPSQHRFDGSFISDTSVAFPYTGTFASHFPGDGCCTMGGGQPTIAFLPPATGWGAPTASTVLMAGLGAEAVSPRLAKGQHSATASVTGTGLGKTIALVAEPQSKPSLAALCVRIALFASLPDTKYQTRYITDLFAPNKRRAISVEVHETRGDRMINFLLSMVACLDALNQQQAGQHAADATTAAACPVHTQRLKIAKLTTKRIRYAPAGRAGVSGLTVTCVRGSTGFAVHLKSHGKDRRTLLGPRLVLGLYQTQGTTTAQVTFGNGAAPSWTGNWNTDFGAMHLTQSGHHVTGIYAYCHGTATISGPVTGSVLDGTWAQPCNSKQGRIHFVLSPDGTSFKGMWSYGTATPAAPWNGTRT